MVVIIVTDSQMGFSSIERNRIWASNYNYNSKFSSAFLICRRPIFGPYPKKYCKVKQDQVLSSRALNNGAISVLLKGDSGITEKEFDFKPSFDEYLKALESVKSNRQMVQTPNSTKSKSKSKNDATSEGDVENDKLGDLVSTQEALTVGKTGYKERVIRKVKDATNMRVEDKINERRVNRPIPSNLYVNKDKLENTKVIKRKLSSDSQNGRRSHNQTSTVQERQTNGKFEEHEFKEDVSRYRTSGLERQKNPNFEERKFKEDNSRCRTSRRDEMDHFQDNKVPYKRNKNNLNSNESFKPILDESSDEDDELDTERAAFKSMDFNDVYNKPQVSRVDMEERIQKLAKCLNGADIEMPEWMFSKMMRSARIRFSDHSVLRVIQILGRLGNWRRVLQVIEWMESRERFKSHKLRYIYTAALDALGKARRPVEALNLFHSMQKQMSSYPDLVAYHCIAVTLGQAGHMKELFDVIDIMRSPPKKKFKSGILQHWDPRLEPDIVVYNAVLNACVHRKNWEGAFWVLQQLKQQGQQPSTATYGLVMEVMFACGKYNLVHDFFSKMQKSLIPNALTYKVLVNTLWKEGKIDEAIMTVRDMEGRGIIGSAGLYYDLARCFCSAGRSQEALMQVEKICKVANKPLVVTYTGLIQACLDYGKIESGEYIFNHMQNYCSPNLVTCNIMLKGYLDHQMFEAAIELFDKLTDNVNRINNTLDYKDKVIPDIYTFNLILDACASNNKWDDFERVYKMMLQHGFHFNSKRHLRLILDASRAGKVDLLEITWKHLVNWDQTPPPLLIKEMFRLKLEQDDYVGALSCVADHSLMLSSKSWSSFFSENRDCFGKETLIRLVHEVSALTSESETRNLVFENLVSSCKEILSSGN